MTSIPLEGSAPSLLEMRSGTRSPGTDGADALQVTISEHVIGSGRANFERRNQARSAALVLRRIRKIRQLTIYAARAGHRDLLQAAQSRAFRNFAPDRFHDEFEGLAVLDEKAPTVRELVRTQHARFGHDIMQVDRSPTTKLFEFRFFMELPGSAAHLLEQLQIKLVTGALKVVRFIFGKQRIAVAQRGIMESQPEFMPFFARMETLQSIRQHGTPPRIDEKVGAGLFALEAGGRAHCRNAHSSAGWAALDFGIRTIRSDVEPAAEVGQRDFGRGDGVSLGARPNERQPFQFSMVSGLGSHTSTDS